MGFLDETGLARVWGKIKSDVTARFSTFSDQIAKSYSGTATEPILKDTVFFSNNVLRVALANIASGEAITNTNSQITKISNLVGGANMSEILKSVYVAPVKFGYNLPDEATYEAVKKALDMEHEFTGGLLFIAPSVASYKFLTWELGFTSAQCRFAELEDGRAIAFEYTAQLSGVDAIAIYVRE